MAINVHLVGKKWRSNGIDMLDGFKVISVDLELAEWINNEQLYNYMSSTYFDNLPLPGDRLWDNQITEIIETLTNEPSKIYGNNLKQAEEDLIIFIKIREWLKNNHPHAIVEYDVAYSGP